MREHPWSSHVCSARVSSMATATSDGIIFGRGVQSRWAGLACLEGLPRDNQQHGAAGRASRRKAGSSCVSPTSRRSTSDEQCQILISSGSCSFMGMTFGLTWTWQMGVVCWLGRRLRFPRKTETEK